MGINKVLFDALRREARSHLKGILPCEEHGLVDQDAIWRKTVEGNMFRINVLKTLSMKGTKP